MVCAGGGSPVASAEGELQALEENALFFLSCEGPSQGASAASVDESLTGRGDRNLRRYSLLLGSPGPAREESQAW